VGRWGKGRRYATAAVALRGSGHVTCCLILAAKVSATVICCCLRITCRRPRPVSPDHPRTFPSLPGPSRIFQTLHAGSGPPLERPGSARRARPHDALVVRPAGLLPLVLLVLVAALAPAPRDSGSALGN